MSDFPSLEVLRGDSERGRLVGYAARDCWSSQRRHASEAQFIGRTKFVMKVIRGRVGLAQVIVLLVENLDLCNQLLQEVQ